jgi:hypothetical protein
MEINYVLSRQDIYEACMHKLKPQIKKVPVRALIAALCIFAIQMCIYIVSDDGLNRINVSASILFTVIGFFTIYLLMNFRMRKAAKKYASGISPASDSFKKCIIFGDDSIQFIGTTEIKSGYQNIKSIELSENYLYIDMSGITVFVPVSQIQNEKAKILEILCLKALSAEHIGF